MTESVGVAIVTLNAETHIPRLLPNLLASPLKPKILIVDSSSNDNTAKLGLAYGADVRLIERGSFNHGKTRENARKWLGTDIVVMMTQDAYLESPDSLALLVEPLIKQEASLSYARQIPHKQAGLLESFARRFNYPEQSHIRGLEDIETYGVYTFFISNSCAAYKSSALDDAGGFPETLLGEDTAVCAQLLLKGHKVAYVAESRVFHSHNYSLKQEFKRSFDTGYARDFLLELGLSDTKRGLQYAKCLMKTLYKKPWHMPHAFLSLISKYAGYKIGRHAKRLPLEWKKRLSSQPHSTFWQSKAKD